MTVGLWSLPRELRARQNTVLRARRNRTDDPASQRRRPDLATQIRPAVACRRSCSSARRIFGHAQRARREVEVRVLRAGAVIERFHSQFILSDLSPLATAAARMHQHALDD